MGKMAKWQNEKSKVTVTAVITMVGIISVTVIQYVIHLTNDCILKTDELE